MRNEFVGIGNQAENIAVGAGETKDSGSSFIPAFPRLLKPEISARMVPSDHCGALSDAFGGKDQESHGLYAPSARQIRDYIS
jgi:hypothetical protein